MATERKTVDIYTIRRHWNKPHYYYLTSESAAAAVIEQQDKADQGLLNKTALIAAIAGLKLNTDKQYLGVSVFKRRAK